MRTAGLLIPLAALAFGAARAAAQTPEKSMPFQDPNLPVSQRVDDLIGRMTLEEKASQMLSAAPPIPRLGIPEYDWWNEALHGVARNGIATVFPQAIGLAATWDTDLHYRVATVISDEARAKYHDAIRRGIHKRYAGLTFWSPNINIFRDPRWGRGQETYGEDPFLTSQLGVAFVKGMQGDDPKYLKTVATPKHFAVHSGPEPARHRFDARISDTDLFNTYLPAFRATVVEGKAESVMCAYNALDGEPCCSDARLLTDILRNQWGFRGYVVSDCDAIHDIQSGHKTVATLPEAAAIAVKAGTELNCGGTYNALPAAVRQGLIKESEIDEALRRLFTARFRLGMFDPPAMVKYAQIPASDNDSPAHEALALQAARESVVLLKNTRSMLPLSKDLKHIVVIGPDADNLDVLVGNYNGTPARPVTVLQGIRNKVGQTADIACYKGSELAAEAPDRADALAKAATADAVIMVMGISPKLEGEEMTVDVEGFTGGDRISLGLPKAQEDLIRDLNALGKPIVLVLMSGSALAVNWAAANVPAIVQAWYPGEQGGNAVADVLFGDYNPAGRLPVTFYRSERDLPVFADYSMQGRTYRYFHGKPLYPFGYGLSYTAFKYGSLKLSPAKSSPGQPVTVTVEVRNTGLRGGDEVVQVYVRDTSAGPAEPIKQLKAFRRIHLDAGRKATVRFVLPEEAFAWYRESAGRFTVSPGAYEIQVGASSSDIRVKGEVRKD